MKQVFAPGCALQLYKPQLAQRTSEFLNSRFGLLAEHDICCHFDPRICDTQIITVCSGCERRFRTLYRGIETISLWEVLDGCPDFPFPDYRAVKMSIHDACPTKSQFRVLRAVRSLLSKMNIEVIEPENTGSNAVCCGDSYYGQLPVKELKAKMAERAAQMPCEDVVVYCISCIKAMHIGGKAPRYLLDLLLGEKTDCALCEPDAWHAALDGYKKTHRG